MQCELTLLNSTLNNGQDGKIYGMCILISKTKTFQLLKQTFQSDMQFGEIFCYFNIEDI